jgi:NitT/TauT family transport system permease protein
LLLMWQIVCTLLEVPPLVPTPALIAKTLVADWGMLMESLLVTLKITSWPSCWR